MKLAVLVSGQGTNLGALLAAEKAGDLAPAEVSLVVSNRAGVGALDKAAVAGKPSLVIEHGKFENREAFEDALLAALAEHSIDAVILAGFMRVLTTHFVSAFPNRIINTHPALCPAFAGVAAPKQAIEHGVRVSGCTVHFVDDGVDTGPIIAQAAVEVLETDDASSLHRRIQVEEHRLLPLCARMLAEGRLHVEGRRVRIAAEPAVAD